MTARLLTAEEVALQLGIELDTLYRYARSGRIRGLKIGNLWRFYEADVDAFIQSRRYQPSGAPPSNVALLTEVLTTGGPRRGGVVCGALRHGYEELDRSATRLAAALRRDGVAAGDRVVVILPTCSEFLVACFAIWKLGAIAVPEFVGIRPPNLRHVLADARPSALIVDDPVAQRIDELRAELPLDGVRAILIKDATFTLSGLESVAVHALNELLDDAALEKGFKPVHARPDQVVLLNYTSGSTGTPKGVMHTHESVLAGAEFTRRFHAVGPADSIVIPLPLHHGLAFRQLFAYALSDATIILATDIYQALRLLKDYHPTALVLVPAAANLVLDHFAAVLGEASRHLRYVEVGSAAFAPERLARFRELLPHTKVHLPYGLTEARVGFLERGSEGAYNRIATVATGLELFVIDADGQRVASGQTGNIVLRGQGLMLGYWGQSGEHFEHYKANGFATGDLGRLMPDGSVELLGRMDDMLKIGGRKVNPTEVEAALARHPAVADSAVAAVSDPNGVFETQLHAFVVLHRGAAATEEELLSFARQQIEPYKLPGKIHFRTSLPKSAVGKILRSELARERAAASVTPVSGTRNSQEEEGQR